MCTNWYHMTCLMLLVGLCLDTTQWQALTALLLLLPCAHRCLQEVGCHLQKLSDVAGRWLGVSDQQDRDQRLAAQQELLDRAAHFGQLLGLVAMGAVALRAGRLWEVHQVGWNVQ